MAARNLAVTPAQQARLRWAPVAIIVGNLSAYAGIIWLFRHGGGL